VGAGLAAQAVSGGAALCVGALLGLLYDVLRVLRERMPRGLWFPLDFGFWACAAAGLFAFALRFGGGQVRIYQAAGFFLGGCAYFFTIGRLILPVLRLAARVLARFFSAAAAPARRMARLTKNFFKNRKKVFQIWFRWYRINMINHPVREKEKGVDSGEAQTGRDRDEICHPGAAGGVRHSAAVHEQPAQPGRGGAGRAGADRPGSAGEQRRPGRRHRQQQRPRAHRRHRAG